MPAYHVDRSIRIDANQDNVRPAVEDFKEWPKWSPWLCMEPKAKVEAYGTPGQPGHGYNWEGELTGAGGMKITSIQGGRQIMAIEFLKPFKSRASVTMDLKPVGEAQTDVTWSMDGKMPIFLFFMIGMMKRMIGMDYERGLKMLKEYVETGNVKSQTEIVGMVDYPGTHYVGVGEHCAIDEIGPSMEQTLPAARDAAVKHGLEIAGPPGAIYRDFDIKAQKCHYTAFVQVATPASIDGVTNGRIEPCRALKVAHTGAYRHLGNAWSTAMQVQRHQKLKAARSMPPFELYVSDPCETTEPELVTEIFIPVRT